jgi:hypothetical protein
MREANLHINVDILHQWIAAAGDTQETAQLENLRSRLVDAIGREHAAAEIEIGNINARVERLERSLQELRREVWASIERLKSLLTPILAGEGVTPELRARLSRQFPTALGVVTEEIGPEKTHSYKIHIGGPTKQ